MKASSWSPLASRPWPASSPAASARRCSCSVTSLTGIDCDGTSSSVSASAHASNVVYGAADDSDAPRREFHMLSYALYCSRAACAETKARSRRRITHR